ncbi:MAG TPA: SDR family NAD(P)-dependent oxidoreductase [Polyangiales bacterium]
MSTPKQPRVVVTGGAGGLGRAFCLVLAERGGKLLISDRDLAGAEKTARLVTAAGGTAHAVSCDVSKREQVESLVALAEQHLGGTDLLINNAGVAVSGAIGAIPIPDWEWIVSINLRGTIYGCHAFVPYFKKQGSGHILNVASAAGFLSAPEIGPYNVTKAAVISLSETLCGELIDHKIGVTALCPTFFQTNILSSSRSETINPHAKAAATRRRTKSRLQADDVARAALASCDKNELHCVPMPDGLWGWRLKRLSPKAYFTLMPRMLKREQRLLAQ